MPGRRTLTLFALAALLVARAFGPSTAVAQQPPLTVSPEDYSWLADIGVGIALQAPADVNQRPACATLALPCLSPRTFGDVGGAIAGAFYPADAIGIVGELSGYGNNWSSTTPNCDPRHTECSTHQVNSVFAALAGLRLRTPPINGGSSHGRFFAQLLAGSQWSDLTPRQHVYQAGAGGEGYLRSGLGVRFEFDYRFAPSENGGRNLSTDRVFIGLLIPLGSQ